MKKFLVCLSHRVLGWTLSSSVDEACKELHLPMRQNRETGQTYGYFDMVSDHEKIYFLEFPSLSEEMGGVGFKQISSNEELDQLIN